VVSAVAGGPAVISDCPPNWCGRRGVARYTCDGAGTEATARTVVPGAASIVTRPSASVCSKAPSTVTGTPGTPLPLASTSTVTVVPATEARIRNGPAKRAASASSSIARCCRSGRPEACATMSSDGTSGAEGSAARVEPAGSCA
jgi:hypothetical protein